VVVATLSLPVESSRLAPAAAAIPRRRARGVDLARRPVQRLRPLAAGSDGKVYAWGVNNYSELGDGTTTDRTSPVAVSLPGGAQATAVSAGANHSLALASHGSVYSWGFDVSGALGDGVDETRRSTPAMVPLPAGVTATQVHAGTDSNLALYSTDSAPPVSHCR
jgi:alpha-tubulin suppressor-like RCC1 family protein